MENISPMTTQDTGPNPTEYAEMQIPINITDTMFVVISGIISSFDRRRQPYNPAELIHINTAEDINSLRRPTLSMTVIDTDVMPI